MKEILVPGSIWQTKNNTLIQVLYISNLKLNQSKRPTQVIFRRKQDVISLSIKDFKKIATTYVGQDSVVADSLYDILSTPIGVVDREEVPNIVYKLTLEKEDPAKNCKGNRCQIHRSSVTGNSGASVWQMSYLREVLVRVCG